MPCHRWGWGHRASLTLAPGEDAEGSGAAWSRSPLTFYYVLPGKAPLRLCSEKQATARVMSQAVLGKMFMMQMLGKKNGSALPRGVFLHRGIRPRGGGALTQAVSARLHPGGWGPVGMEASAFQFSLLLGLEFFKFKKESYF